MNRNRPEDKVSVVNYKSTPDDQWIQGIATVKVEVPVYVLYALRKGKSGESFVTCSSFQVSQGGEKKFEKALFFPDMFDEKNIKNYLESEIKKISSGFEIESNEDVAPF